MAPIGEKESRLTLAKREIGHAGGYHEGPVILCMAGLHGNEPSGVHALRRVFRTIESEELSLQGELVGLAGNLRALAAGKRFLASDLNRLWTRERARSVRSAAALAEEDLEQAELLDAMGRVIEKARGEVIVFDLHTTSSKTVPFTILGDTLKNREFALSFPVPVVLGLEEQLDGTLMEYVTGLGHRGVAFEAGQHDDPRSVDHHEAAIWLAMVRAGVLDEREAPGYRAFASLLERAGAGVPRALEVFSRRAVGEGFQMRPDYRNFDCVRKGEVLAGEKKGPVVAPVSCRIFLPLYQAQGSDGFFLARPVNRIWLALSAFLRRLGLARVIHLLPGVRRHPELKNTLVVNGRIARFFVRELFHLLGFRIQTAKRGLWILEKRRE